jgi:hypothetical protein
MMMHTTSGGNGVHKQKRERRAYTNKNRSLLYVLVGSSGKLSGNILPATPIIAIVKNGDMPELPDNVNEKAVLATVFITWLIIRLVV